MLRKKRIPVRPYPKEVCQIGKDRHHVNGYADAF